ncbi:MAG: right-handed parallel beta-helix repeat-containing protein [Pseudomonadota bacterium]|nr:right-handed parallel beta-helix repeat-containing protein [Pseudomonadota bacterium]
MNIELLKAEAFARCQTPFVRPVTYAVPILDPPSGGGHDAVGMVFQEELAVRTKNFLEKDGFYFSPRPRAAVNTLPMEIFIDQNNTGSFSRKTWEDADPEYSSRTIRPPINKSEIPAAGRVLTELIIGHKSPIGDFPQLFDIRSSAYVRFAGYPPQITGASLRLGAHGLFGLNGKNEFGVPEDFPIVRSVYAKVIDQKTANALVLVDSELFCSAMNIDMVEGENADMIVDSYWYTRKDFKWKNDPHTGFIAFSSMAWKNEKATPWTSGDEAHDSDMMTVVYKNGRVDKYLIEPPSSNLRIRDLTNRSGKKPEKSPISEWILANEDRNPSHYSEFRHALGHTNYNLRASYKVTILESSVKTGVSLYEQATDGEYADNIVAVSTIRQNIQKATSVGDFVRFKYKTTSFFPDKVKLNQVDDCDPIRTALSQLPSEGGEVSISAGLYNCANPIVINRSNVTLRGAGEDKVTIRLKDYSHRPLLIIGEPVTIRDSYGNYVTAKRVENIVVSGITFDGNLAHQDVTKECGDSNCDGDSGSIRNNGITIRGASRVLVENVTTHSMISGGMVTEKFCTGLIVRNFTSYKNYFDGFAGYETENSLFYDLYLHSNRGAGISIDINFNNNTFRDSTLKGNGDVGVFARDLKGNKFVRLDILDSGNHGVFLAQAGHANSCAVDNTFDSVRINGSKRSGFRLNDRCHGNRITGQSNLCHNAEGGISESVKGTLVLDDQVSCR